MQPRSEWLLMCLLTYAKSGLGYKVPYFIPCRLQKQTKNKTPQVVALDASLRFTFDMSAIQATVITYSVIHSSKRFIEEVTWTSSQMFPPQETLRSDEQNKLFELLNLAKTKLKLKGRVKRNKK